MNSGEKMRRSDSAWNWASGIMDEIVQEAEFKGRKLTDEEMDLLRDFRTMAFLIGDKDKFMPRLQGLWDEFNKESQ